MTSDVSSSCVPSSLLSRNTAGDVFSSNSDMLSSSAAMSVWSSPLNSLSMFWGGSLSANRGCSLGRTTANSFLSRFFEISNTFGSKNGSKYGSFISSSSERRILPFFKRSEKLGRTRTSPRRNVAFSSRGLEANVVGSRKLSVEMASEEKKGWLLSDCSETRMLGVRVRRRGNRSVVSS